jgi:hypothetical protein
LGSARADGPPIEPLVPPAGAEQPAAADTARARRIAPGAFEDVGEGNARPASLAPAGRGLWRKVAIASGVALVGFAVWRDRVADDRAGDYRDAIFPESAAALRESVRDAERERNVLAALAAASFSVALLSFVY